MSKDKLARAIPAFLAAVLMSLSLMTSARANVSFVPTNQYSQGAGHQAMMRCPDACAGWIAAGAAVVAAGAAVVQAAAATAAAAAAESIIIIVVLATPGSHHLAPAARTSMSASLDR